MKLDNSLFGSSLTYTNCALKNILTRRNLSCIAMQLGGFVGKSLNLNFDKCFIIILLNNWEGNTCLRLTVLAQPNKDNTEVQEWAILSYSKNFFALL